VTSAIPMHALKQTFARGEPKLNAPQGWKRVGESAPKLECQCPDLPQRNGEAPISMSVGAPEPGKESIENHQ